MTTIGSKAQPIRVDYSLTTLGARWVIGRLRATNPFAELEPVILFEYFKYAFAIVKICAIYWLSTTSSGLSLITSPALGHL